MKYSLTEISMAYWASQDEGDRHMRKAGRKTWSIDDYNHAVKTFKKLTASVSTESK